MGLSGFAGCAMLHAQCCLCIDGCAFLIGMFAGHQVCLLLGLPAASFVCLFFYMASCFAWLSVLLAVGLAG